jgi:dTDP-4-amino-4,6-dideoxygalactose transaminase
MDLARQEKLLVIEDCAQAHGATINGKPVGSFGDAGCFSFCQDKIITTAGEGGMVVTNDSGAFQRMWSQRDHGKDFERSRNVEDIPGFKWLVTSFGTNWRLTEPQSAIGRLQLRKLPQWTKMRRENAAILDEKLLPLDAVSSPSPPPHLSHAYYKYCGFMDLTALKEGWSRNRICDALNKKHIPIKVGACPDISREQAFKAAFGVQPQHPNAESIADRSFMLPVHPTLSADNMSFIADTVREVILSATR